MEELTEIHITSFDEGGIGNPGTSSANNSLKPVSVWRARASFSIFCIINLVCGLNATILSAALPAISTKLKITALEAFWISISYLLASTLLQPAWTSLGHILGKASMLVVSIALLAAGSIIAAAAPHDVSVLLGGRSIQGVGGGGIIALTCLIVGEVVGIHNQTKYLGIMALSWCIGATVGPVLGAGLAQYKWPLIFWLNLPFCIIGLVGVPACLRLHQLQNNVVERLKSFDVLGLLLFLTSGTSFLVALTWGGTTYAWSSWQSTVPLMLGLFGVLVFFEYSRVVSNHPLFRKIVFTNATGTVSYIGTTIYGTILFAFVLCMPLYYQVAKGLSAVQSALSLNAFTMPLCATSLITTMIISLTGRFRNSIWLGGLVTLLGTSLLLLMKPSTTMLVSVLLSFLPGIGLGILFPALSTSCVAPATSTDLPIAAATSQFFFSLGQTLGVAISSTILQNAFNANVLKSPVLVPQGELEWESHVVSFTGFKTNLTDEENEVKTAFVTAYADSLRWVWVFCSVVAAVGLLLGLFCMKEPSLARVENTEHQRRWKKFDEQTLWPDSLRSSTETMKDTTV